MTTHCAADEETRAAAAKAVIAANEAQVAGASTLDGVVVLDPQPPAAPPSDVCFTRECAVCSLRMHGVPSFGRKRSCAPYFLL